LSPKRLELLLEVVPEARKIGLLVNYTSRFKGAAEQGLREVVERSGQALVLGSAAAKDELPSTFLTFKEKGIDALVILPDPLFAANMPDLAALSAKHRFPSVYSHRDFVVAGGLMSYGSSFTEAYRQAGVYVARILNGENVGDLPVIQPTKFELAINLGAAKELGISASAYLLARADEIIER
jgi:putative ABC transport system substrate-binding protein